MLATIALTLALLLTAASAERFSRWLVQRLGLGAFSPGALFGVFWVAGLLGPLALFARLFGDFDLGLWASAIVGLGGLYLTKTVPRLLRPPVLLTTRTWFFVALAVVVVVYAWVSISYQIHDEQSLFGHKSMIEQIRRGSYPLYFPPLPLDEARYHYGFDLLTGALARAYGLKADTAIDLVSIAMAILMSWCAAAVAADNDAERSAPLAAVAIHFGAGLAFLMLPGIEGLHPRCLVQYHDPSCKVDLFPPPFLNFFQHPVSVGVPLMLVGAILLPRLALPEPRARKDTFGLAGLIVLLMAALAVSQFVYYALIAIAAVVAYPFYTVGKGGLRRPGHWLVLVSSLALSLGIAKLSGGMLAPNQWIDPTLFGLREIYGFPDRTGFLGVLYHHAVNLGIGFVLFPVLTIAALRSRRPGLLTLLAFATGGMIVPQLYVYARSWDVVKFPSASAFALSMAYVLVIDRALALRPPPFTWIRRLGAGLLMGSGITAAAFLAWPLPPGKALYSLGHYGPDPLVHECMEWLWANGYRKEELVFAQSNVARELSVTGGMSVVADDTDLYYVGIKLDFLYHQRALAGKVKASLDEAALRELKVKWLIYSNEELRNFSQVAKNKLSDPLGPFEPVAEIAGPTDLKTRRIWRLRDDTGPKPEGAPPPPPDAGPRD